MGIDFLIEKGTLGIVNLVGNDFLSPYEIGMLLAQEFSLNKAKIGKISMDEFYSGSAKRPFKVRLQNDKLRNLGFEMTDFYEALKKISSKSRT
ncbi:MAG: dTDP-4-dehydrorhamnose reductase [Candidatus Levybacteria bacterium GW2011_GWB1_39_7]|nr:MAG: dTDP-4-dehydrorhamnose reductase [Candidatus Levybacteria bacterium GW2011_GWB1_39_7]